MTYIVLSMKRYYIIVLLWQNIEFLTKYRINKDINVKIKDADGNYSIDIVLNVDRVVFLLLYYYQFIYYQHLIYYL